MDFNDFRQNVEDKIMTETGVDAIVHPLDNESDENEDLGVYFRYQNMCDVWVGRCLFFTHPKTKTDLYMLKYVILKEAYLFRLAVITGKAKARDIHDSMVL